MPLLARADPIAVCLKVYMFYVLPLSLLNGLRNREMERLEIEIHL
jgi:hypothetical protein